MRELNKLKPEQLAENFKKLPEVLKQLGFTSLRKGQDQSVACTLGGNDSLVILPTATGKSACYIIPTLVQGWKTLIFSPLIALMQDQVESLQNKGCRAGQLSSLQTPQENEMVIADWEMGELDFLIVAPERFRNEKFLKAISITKPNMVCVDEAHTLSAWSDNFRSDYCKIGDFVKDQNPDVVLCLTATCPPEVEEDVRRVVGIPDAEKIVHMPPRENLKFSSSPWLGDYDLLERINAIDGPTLVYCATVKEVERLYATLKNHIRGKALIYHGQMTKKSERQSNQDSFMNNHVRVMFSTNSFGMGVDKPDIRAVFHRDLPGSPEAYAQESGRGGRDGSTTICHMFYDDNSVKTQQFFIQNGHPDRGSLTAFYNAVVGRLSPEGVCNAKVGDLATEAGIHFMSIQAVLQIMYGSKVLERQGMEKLAKVKFLSLDPESKYAKYYEMLETLGIPDGEGYLEVDIDLLTVEAGFSESTVKKHLADMDKLELIEYAAPPKVKPLKVIGDLKNIDFDRLRQKEADAYAKLDDMIRYHKTPSEDKQQFLIKCFLKD
jgi:ATP-dependent DNA helicase RecQ